MHNKNNTLNCIIWSVLNLCSISVLIFVLVFLNLVVTCALTSEFKFLVNGISFVGCLGAFTKLWKATVKFVMSVCPSVCVSVCPSIRMKQFGSHRTDFDEIWYLSFFWKSFKEVQVSLKANKNDRYFTWRFHIYDHILLNSSYNEKFFESEF